MYNVMTVHVVNSEEDLVHYLRCVVLVEHLYLQDAFVELAAR